MGEGGARWERGWSPRREPSQGNRVGGGARMVVPARRWCPHVRTVLCSDVLWASRRQPATSSPLFALTNWPAVPPARLSCVAPGFLTPMLASRRPTPPPARPPYCTPHQELVEEQRCLHCVDHGGGQVGLAAHQQAPWEVGHGGRKGRERARRFQSCSAGVAVRPAPPMILLLTQCGIACTRPCKRPARGQRRPASMRLPSPSPAHGAHSDGRTRAARHQQHHHQTRGSGQRTQQAAACAPLSAAGGGGALCRLRCVGGGGGGPAGRQRAAAARSTSHGLKFLSE